MKARPLSIVAMVLTVGLALGASAVQARPPMTTDARSWLSADEQAHYVQLLGQIGGSVVAVAAPDWLFCRLQTR
jgi:hypothetical protein